MSIVRVTLTTEDGEILDRFAVEDISQDIVSLSHEIRDVLDEHTSTLDIIRDKEKR